MTGPDDLIRRGDALRIFEPETSMVRRRICDDVRAIPSVSIAALSEVQAELNRALAQIESLDAECDRRHAALEQMQAERDAALAGAVKVRPLVWKDGNFCGQQESYADTEFGSFMVVACIGLGGRWAYTDPSGDDSEDDWVSAVAAKAAAQADYEARINASIQPDTEAVEMAEAAAFSAGFEAGQRDEREACAVLIETRDGSIPYRQEIAAAIRKRGED